MKFPITVMYNPKDRKIGSIPAQIEKDCTIPTVQIVRYFSLSRIEKERTKLSKFTISTKAEFDRIVKLTHEP